MSNIPIELKIEILISKIKDGKRKYQELPLMNSSINVLARDGEPILIIDQLIQIIQEQHNRIDLKMNKKPPQYPVKN